MLPWCWCAIWPPEKSPLKTLKSPQFSLIIFRNVEKREIQPCEPKRTGRIRFSRGNARNYDLNRDFIKNDTENAKAFQQIYQHFKPIFFIDNHVSNGADYQYLFTYISTNKERLGDKLGSYFTEKMQPEILASIEKRESLPFRTLIFMVIPDEGFPAFMDSLRYATGYTTLFSTPWEPLQKHTCWPL